MESEINHYFLTSNSGRGFVNYFDSEISHLNYVYVLKGAPGNGKSTLIRNVGNYFQKQGYAIDMIHSSFDPNSLDGIIVKELGIGVVEGMSPHIIEPKIPVISGERINMDIACDTRQLQMVNDKIIALYQTLDETLSQYSQSIAESLRLHDELEQYFTGSLNIDAANQLASTMIHNIFGQNQKREEATVKHRFFDAITENGNIDFVQELTKNIDTRYFIKGGPGSGKSSLMKQMVKGAQERGYDVELYHCDFDPDSLDMIIIPERNVAAFDSTPPHEYSPEREGDEIIDTYTLMNEADTAEKYKKEINEATDTFESEWTKATSYLRQAKEAYQEIKNIYSQTITFGQIEEIEKDLLKKISLFQQ